jgi:prepilin signal peptidase PulO-like enzyme (type II secretory pathway)
MSALRVGITVPQFRAEFEPAIRAAVAAEELDLDGVFVFDHLWPMGQPHRPATHSQALLGALAAGGLAMLIFLAGALLYRRGDVFGLGDVKLALFIGAVTGFPRALTALIAGIGVGGLLALLVLLRGQSARATMPYGPALTLGAYLTLLLS